MPDFTTYSFEKYGLEVSRETREKFNRYRALLLKWQKAINLVSDTTLEEIEMRHFVDSAQLIKFISDKNIKLADMGSGAGFPGMVLALMGVKGVHLVESDVRKATFLREVSRETMQSGPSGGLRQQISVTVHDERVEDTVISGLDLITARALAPLKDLLTLADKLSGGNPPTCIFLKGEKHEEELARAYKHWNFTAELHQSVTDASGKIIVINDLKRK